jgi:hypothetical protein
VVPHQPVLEAADSVGSRVLDQPRGVELEHAYVEWHAQALIEPLDVEAYLILIRELQHWRRSPLTARHDRQKDVSEVPVPEISGWSRRTGRDRSWLRDWCGSRRSRGGRRRELYADPMEHVVDARVVGWAEQSSAVERIVRFGKSTCAEQVHTLRIRVIRLAGDSGKRISRRRRSCLG